MKGSEKKALTLEDDYRQEMVFRRPSHWLGKQRGLLKAPNGLRSFGSLSDWIEFGWVEGLTLTGGGTFDGQGASSWPLNNCSTNKNCKLLPS
ncbi:hypothetical protein IFM89_006179, partial [Coptis chinensis]